MNLSHFDTHFPYRHPDIYPWGFLFRKLELCCERDPLTRYIVQIIVAIFPSSVIALNALYDAHSPNSSNLPHHKAMISPLFVEMCLVTVLLHSLVEIRFRPEARWSSRPWLLYVCIAHYHANLKFRRPGTLRKRQAR